MAGNTATRYDAPVMTPAERNQAVSDLVIRYSENLKTIAALRSQLRSIGAHLRTLGEALSNSLNNVEVTDDRVTIAWHSEDHRLSDVDIDGDSLRDTLREYRAAITEDAELVADLEQAGLSNIIQKEPQRPRR